jgi:hypothetical protein
MEECVTLVSAQGHEFVIEKKAAMISGTIKALLSGSGSFAEVESGKINFKEINTPILEKVCEYFYYKLKYTHPVGEVPDFKIDPEMALEVLMAANFLDA